MKVTGLYVYPIKSLGGISLETAIITETGFAYDRYWMLVDENGIALTQREYPMLALFGVELLQDNVVVQLKGKELKIEKQKEDSEPMQCTLFGNGVAAIQEKAEYSEWFSDLLQTKVYLVRKATNPKRFVKNHPDAIVNFPDSNPFLILGESSLMNLNSKLDTPVPMNRFRPNIIFSESTPHIEDQWDSIQISDAIFEVTKPCARCNLTTIDQSTAAVGVEPLRTLTQYRRFDRKVLFGQYLKTINKKVGEIKVGDELHILS
ncbi:MAG: MOSC N-terminal beta barrel domain-containing protein [Bacteroidota bacterium]